MAETSIFWTTNGTGDGTGTGYTMAKMVDWLRRTFVSDNPASQGVLVGYNNELAVSGTSSPVSVATGAAVVYGYPYENDAAATVAIPTPAGNTRIDRIVLRCDWTAQTVRITRLAGTEGSGVPPAITQTPNTTYDLKLAQVSITTGGVITVTDERGYCHFATRVASENIDDNAVTNAKILNSEITGPKIATHQIGEAHLEHGSVSGDVLATNAVTWSKIATDSIMEGHIITGAVSTTKLTDLNVTAAKLAADAVETAKIKDLNVTTGKLADDAVTQPKIGPGAVGPTELQYALRMAIIPVYLTTVYTQTSADEELSWTALTFDKAKLPAGGTAKLHVVGDVAAGSTVSARLYDVTGGALVTGALVNVSSPTSGETISGDFMAGLGAGDRQYKLRLSRTAGSDLAHINKVWIQVEW